MAIPDRRIRRYHEAATAMRAGRFDHDLPVGPPDEVGELGAALVALGRHLQRRFTEMDTLARLTEHVNEGVTLDEVLDHIYHSFGALIPYDRIGFALLDAGGHLQVVWARADYPSMSLPLGYSAPLAGSSLEAVLQTGQPRVINDLEAYYAEHPGSEATRRLLDEGVRSSLTCPLLSNGRPVGVMFFSSRARETYRFAHISLFQQIAGQLAAIVEKSRLCERLVGLDRAKNQLLGVVAHDLRNPIGIVRGYAQILAKERLGPCTAAQRDVLTRMMASCDAMLALVNDLLDVSAIESGHLELRPDDVPIGPWLQGAVEPERIMATAKGIELAVDAADELPVVRVDPTRMTLVLSNLVGNAVKYSHPNTRVTISARVADAQVELAVADQGQGIPEGERDRLFRPFGRTSVRPTAGESSTGLGLAICRRVVEAHGGRLSVASAVGQGSTFTVSLPMSGVPAPARDEGRAVAAD